MTVTVRPAVPEELVALAEMTASSDPWRHFRYTAEECLTRLAAPGHDLYVAESDGVVVGLVLVNPHSSLSGVDIRYLCVGAAWRGRGLGTRLVAFVCDELYPTESVNLTVSDVNHGARRLYRRLGFQPIGLIPDYNFQGEDEYILRLHRGPKRQHLAEPDAR